MPVEQVNEQLLAFVQLHLEPHSRTPPSDAPVSGTPASGAELAEVVGGVVAVLDAAGAPTGASFGMFQS